MTESPSTHRDMAMSPRRHYPLPDAPLLRASESASTVFLITLAAAYLPLLAGIVLMGWRAAYIACIAVVGCLLVEWSYHHVTRRPSVLGRSHAVLTGLLLALTLPAFVPWYVPLMGAVFAIVLGKAVFGGVGHFVWQPALVGRLAVAVMFPAVLMSPSAAHPQAWPVLSQNNILIGNINDFSYTPEYEPWHGRPAPPRSDAFLLPRPEAVLAPLTRGAPAYSSLWSVSPTGSEYPAALSKMPIIDDLIMGVVPGGMGETSAAIIIIAGLYLIYRHYAKWQLPVAIILSAAVTVAIAPVQLIGAGDTVGRFWWPVFLEGFDVGLMYVAYHVCSGGLLLAAFFLATEQTTRPVTTGGQVLFGIGCGVGGMLLRLYTPVAIPCYLAVLAMNTFTQAIDRMWQPLVFGRRRWPILAGLRAHRPTGSPKGGEG